MTNEDVAAKLAEHDNRIRVSEHRLKDVEEAQAAINKLTISVHEMAISLKHMVEEQKEQSKRLDMLEGKPGKKWEKASDTVMTTIIGGLVGAIVTIVITLMALGI